MSGFTGFAVRRAVSAALTLLALSVIIYVVFYATPGNVAQITCGPRCSPEQVHQVAQQLRLDDPLYLRYWHFLQGVGGGGGGGAARAPAPPPPPPRRRAERGRTRQNTTHDL
ncbi:hypothetical protein AB0N53_39525, partial [Streptomyces sp. NPDC093990]